MRIKCYKNFQIVKVYIFKRLKSYSNEYTDVNSQVSYHDYTKKS